MTKQELLDKGITLNGLTAMMHQAEKLIAYFNCKYDFDMDKASASERAEWQSTIERWDIMKMHRDTMKAH